jgi:hypothetical protein
MKRPRKGERYRGLDEVEVSGIVAFRGVPVSQSCGGSLPAGTVIRVLGDPNERASAITARPVQYRKFERLLVSADDRAERHYDGYYLVVSFADLASHFKLLPADA